MTSFEPSIGFPYWYKGPKSIPSEGLATSKHSLHSVVLSSFGTSKSSPGFKEYFCILLFMDDALWPEMWKKVHVIYVQKPIKTKFSFNMFLPFLKLQT